MTTFIDIPLATPFSVQTPSLLEGDNVPPLTRVIAKRGERTPSLIRTTLLPEFEKVNDPTPKMASISTTGHPKMTKSERHLVSGFAPLKFSDDPKPLPKKYNRWLPKFKGDATMSAHDFVEEFYWHMSPRMTFDEDRLMMHFALSLEGQAREWYFSLPPTCIEDFEDFEDLFMKRWSCNA